MHPPALFCRNIDCPSRDLRNQDNIRVYDSLKQRYRCLTCRKTFRLTDGTVFHGKKYPSETITRVITLLSLGCPLQAIVKWSVGELLSYRFAPPPFVAKKKRGRNPKSEMRSQEGGHRVVTGQRSPTRSVLRYKVFDFIKFLALPSMKGVAVNPQSYGFPHMVRCLLLMEQTSRYSLTTGFLPMSEIPEDGMARVMLSFRYSGKEDMTPYVDETGTRYRDPRVDEEKVHLERHHFAQKSRMVCLAFASLHQSEETITCLGMQPYSAAIALKEMLGEQVKIVPSRRGHHFILLTRPAHSIDENTIWPYIGRNDGCRLFGPISGATKLSSYIEAFEGMIEAGTFDDELWRQFRYDCESTRSDILSLCEMSSACVLSEGPRDRNLAFHSLRFSALEMTNALRSVCESQHILCVIIDNVDEEWPSAELLGE